MDVVANLRSTLSKEMGSFKLPVCRWVQAGGRVRGARWHKKKKEEEEAEEEEEQEEEEVGDGEDEDENEVVPLRLLKPSNEDQMRASCPT